MPSLNDKLKAIKEYIEGTQQQEQPQNSMKLVVRYPKEDHATIMDNVVHGKADEQHQTIMGQITDNKTKHKKTMESIGRSD